MEKTAYAKYKFKAEINEKAVGTVNTKSKAAKKAFLSANSVKERNVATSEEKTHKNKSIEIQAKNTLVLKAMDKIQTEMKRNVQVAEGFRQGIVEAKEKKAAAEVSMVNQDRVLSEAKTKKATQMTREAKAKHAGNTAKKLAGEAEAFTNGMVEKAEEVKSKTRVAKEAFNELSGKAAERTSKHERAGKSSHKEEKQEKEKDKKENVQKAAESKEKEAAQKASEATYKKDQEVKQEKKK